MRITLKQLKAFGACKDGIVWFKQQKNKEAKHILRQCLKDNQFKYANWYVSRLFTKPQAVQYSIFNAERCISNYEQEYPNDNRPRKAIEAAKAWLLNPTEENRSAESAARSAAESAAGSAAWSAESAAWSAAWSAESAAWSAAESAAWSAARSAESAAWSAARSAESAARSAAESAAGSAAESAAGSAAWSAAIEEAIRILGL